MIIGIVIVWALFAIAGAILYRERGFVGGLLGGPVGLLIVYKSQQKADDRARRLKAAAERSRRDRARNAATSGRSLRWPE